MSIPSVLGLCSRVLVAEVCRCEKVCRLLWKAEKASYMSSRPSASQLQDEPAAGQGLAPATHGGSQRGRIVPKGATQDCVGQKHRQHYLREVVENRDHFFPLCFPRCFLYETGLLVHKCWTFFVQVVLILVFRGISRLSIVLVLCLWVRKAQILAFSCRLTQNQKGIPENTKQTPKTMIS